MGTSYYRAKSIQGLNRDYGVLALFVLVAGVSPVGSFRIIAGPLTLGCGPDTRNDYYPRFQGQIIIASWKGKANIPDGECMGIIWTFDMVCTNLH